MSKVIFGSREGDKDQCIMFEALQRAAIPLLSLKH